MAGLPSIPVLGIGESNSSLEARELLDQEVMIRHEVRLDDLTEPVAQRRETMVRDTSARAFPCRAGDGDAIGGVGSPGTGESVLQGIASATSSTTCFTLTGFES